MTAARRRRFERLYDLPERVLPRGRAGAPTPPVEEAQRELIRIASRSLGVAAERDLRDYFRLPTARRRPGSPSWSRPASWSTGRGRGLGPHGRLSRPRRADPAPVDAAALIGPFDSLIWERSRVHRLFGFDYRLEIYVPAAKRRHGYYVLPFLLGDRLVARVDLKADRAAGELLVRALHLEDEAPADTREALAFELEFMAAGWLGLERGPQYPEQVVGNGLIKPFPAGAKPLASATTSRYTF